MKASLQLKISQQLTLTPQLQQAIRLLQLSSLELSQEIQEVLDSNPMLDKEESNDDAKSAEKESFQQKSDINLEAKIDLDASKIPEELPVDTVWDDIYQNSLPANYSSQEETSNYENFCGTTETLKDHLDWQLNLTPFSKTDRAIATTIIEAINDDGFLTIDLDDIIQTLPEPDNDENTIGQDEVLAVLHRIQHFDPLGVASRNLSECLTIQLQQLPPNTPWRDQAQEIIEHDIELLGQRSYPKLQRKYRLKEAQLVEIIQLITKLNPRPGATISPNKPSYVTPDVTARKENNRWVVELNNESIPKLKINNQYANLIQRADNSPSNTYLRNNLQEARWFLKSLQSRHDTLLRVSTCIVEHQQAFLEHGEEAMKPLVLHNVSEALGLHESTVSRVTTNKYLHTPRGVFELKYFFSSHVTTNTGGECSSTAIRAVIKKLVAAENPKKPLSDNKIAQILGNEGIRVARRTIAKYRESLSIPPSNERKSIIV